MTSFEEVKPFVSLDENGEAFVKVSCGLARAVALTLTKVAAGGIPNETERQWLDTFGQILYYSQQIGAEMERERKPDRCKTK